MLQKIYVVGYFSERSPNAHDNLAVGGPVTYVANASESSNHYVEITGNEWTITIADGERIPCKLNTMFTHNMAAHKHYSIMILGRRQNSHSVTTNKPQRMTKVGD